MFQQIVEIANAAFTCHRTERVLRKLVTSQVALRWAPVKRPSYNSTLVHIFTGRLINRWLFLAFSGGYSSTLIE